MFFNNIMLLSVVFNQFLIKNFVIINQNLIKEFAVSFSAIVLVYALLDSGAMYLRLYPLHMFVNYVPAPYTEYASLRAQVCSNPSLSALYLWHKSGLSVCQPLEPGAYRGFSS